MELEDPSLMDKGRKGAFVLLLVAVLWSVLPAANCLLDGRSMDQLACCRAMAPDCPMHSPDMSNSCCQEHQDQTGSLADAPTIPKYGHTAVLPVYAAEAVPAVIAGAGWHVRCASPPQASPGTMSILRI